MENLQMIVQKFLKNKNLVTIIGIIIILILLYFGYSYQINSAVKPVTVPVAAKTIQPRTEITDAMVTTIDMPNISVDNNVITSKMAIVGKYSNVNALIPKGSMFYKDSIINKEDLPDSVFIKVKKGETLTALKVNMETTYGNSIMPGSYIDIYMKAGTKTNEGSKVMVGRLVENAEVLAVKDSSGKNVFENTEESRVPAYLMFGFKEEIYQLILKANYMKSLGVELFPVIHGEIVSTGGATEVSTQQLVDYIEANSVNIPIAETNSTDTLVPTITQDTAALNKVVITYPEGCGTTYVCTYSKDGAAEKTVNKKTQTVTFTANGTISAAVTEADGTIHASETINIDITAKTTR